MEFKNVAIMGAGAIGSMIADSLEKTYKDNFYLIARGWLAEPLVKDGITANGRNFKPGVLENREMVPGKLDLVIITVKNFHLASCIPELREMIDDSTVILPILNGIYAFDTLTREFPNNKVMCGIMVKTDTHPVGKPGEAIFEYTTTGEIQVGEGKTEDKDAAQSVVSLLKNAGLNSNYYENIRYMQWKKWMLNIGVNQVSALTEAEFGLFAKIPEINELMRGLMNEVLSIAKEEGIPLTEEDREELIGFVAKYPDDKQTSMLQDVLAKRKTEIDYFAGDVIRYGKKYGIATPMNEALYLAISAKEKVYMKRY